MSFYASLRALPIFHSVQPQKSLDYLEPGTRAAVEALIKEAGEHGHHLIVLETFRSQARQRQLFAQHATQLHDVGCHGYGVACDLGITGPTGVVNWHADYTLLQALARKHGLIWGGDWGTPHCRHGFKDMDHVQRVPVFRQPALFSGDWYPASTYDPYEDMKQHGVGGIDV